MEQIAAGSSAHACALFSNGTVKCWGSNSSGELGRTYGLGGHSNLPAPVEQLDGVIQISLAALSSCALRKDRTAWCWGDNAYGDLGNGEWGKSFTFPPVQVKLTDIAQISIGFASCAIRTDASLWCWGVWRDGDRANAPVRSPWVDRALALPPNEPRCLVLPDRTAMCRGYNKHGEVGDGTTTPRDAYTAVVGLDGVQEISASRNHACALTVDGSVYCWGVGTDLGVGTAVNSAVPVRVDAVSRARSVVTGAAFSACAVVEDASAWCWGWNGKGQLGDGTSEDRLLPTRVVGLEKVRSIAMGFMFSCALLEDRSVWCWGDNNFGQLGDGTWKPWSYVPVRVKFEGEEADTGGLQP